MGTYSNQYIPTIYRDMTLGSVGFIFRTVDYQGSIKFQNNTWVFDPPLTVDVSGTVDHTTLANIGTNTHAEIDAHIASTSNPHSVTKTQVGLGSVENTALSTWVGSSNISTLGTVATGSWNATTIPVNKGGTGQTTASAAINALVPNQTGNNGKYLTTNGTAVSWAEVTGVTSSSNVETASGIISVIAGSNAITFTTALTSDSYDLAIRCYDSYGNNVNYRVPPASKTTDGFTISVSSEGTLEYRASVGNSVGAGGSGGSLEANDNILNWDPSNLYYIPYTTKQSGLCFYTGTEIPDNSTRLNTNGYFYATRVYSNNAQVITGGSSTLLNIVNSSGTITIGPFVTQQAALSLDTSASTPTCTDRLNINGNVYATNFNTPGTSTFTYLKANILPSTPSHAEGTMYWDTTCHTLNIMPDISGCILQVGQEVWARVINQSGVNIPDGAAVYITGSTGDKITVALARADSEATCLSCIGIATETIANGYEGFITLVGEVRGLDTSSYTPGDLIYLSSSTAGAFTVTRPTAPNTVVSLGVVKRAHATQGIVGVQLRIQPTIERLSNVLVNTATEGQSLTWDATNLRWRNQSINRILEEFYTDAASAGIVETDLYSYTVPANTLTNNGDKLVAEYTIDIPNYSSILTTYFASSSLGTITSGVEGAYTVKVTIVRVSSSVARVTMESSDSTIVSYTELTSKNWATTNILKITGTASGGTITARMGYIEYKPASI